MSIALSCPNTTRFRSESIVASSFLSSVETDLGGIRAMVATTASISFTPMTRLRRASGTSICAEPDSSMTSIALSGSFRSLM